MPKAKQAETVPAAAADLEGTISEAAQVETETESLENALVASSAQDEMPTLPPEMLLEIIKIVHSNSVAGCSKDRGAWKTTLLNFLRASRLYYDLGLPVLMREINV